VLHDDNIIIFMDGFSLVRKKRVVGCVVPMLHDEVLFVMVLSIIQSYAAVSDLFTAAGHHLRLHSCAAHNGSPF
jgi:hypothetical protein